MSQLEVDKVIPQSGTTLTLGESGDTITIASGATFTPTLTAPIIDEINDNNGNEEIIFTTTTSAVNELTIANAATGNAPEIAATGDDTDIDLKLTPKGAGKLNLDGIKFPNADGSAGQFLQTNGSGVLSFSSVSSDFVLLASTVTTSSASVSFDGYFSSTYDNYVIYINGYACATAASDPRVRFRRSNADVTASNYRWISSRGRRSSSTTSIDAGDSGWDDDKIGLSQDMSNAGVTAHNYIIQIPNPLDANVYPSIIFDGTSTNSDNADYYRRYGFGRLTSTGALSGITFYNSSGNIAGRFKLYGIKA